MRKSQALAVALALLLAALAAQTWWSDMRFRGRATRTTGTLVGFESVRVRSLFATELEHYPVVTFVDEGGASWGFTVRTTAQRVGVPPDTPEGSALETAVLYDPADPTGAQLEGERRARGALILLLAALGLVVAPQLLAWAFKSARPLT